MTDIKLLAFSGLLLLGMMLVGLHSVGTLFTTIFAIHLILHATLLCRCTKSLCKLFRGDLLSNCLGIIGTFLPILSITLLSLLPITHRDALIHHLYIPKMWIKSGYIHSLLWHEWSYYPMLLQLAFTGFLQLEIPNLISIYHGSYLLILAKIVLNQSEEHPLRYRQLGVLFCFTTPLLLRLGSSPLVDLPLLVYGLSATFLLFQTHSAAPLIGVVLGLAAGIKYNGLLFCFVFLAIALPFLLTTRRWNIRHAMTMTLLFVLIASPWYIRNGLQTGNPIYPLFHKHFSSAESHDEAIKNQQLSPAINDPLSHSWGVEQLTLPFRMFLFGADNQGEGFDGILSPLLLLFLFSAYQPKARGHATRVSLILTISYALLALELSGPRIRYFAPILGILIILALAGLRNFLTFFNEGTARIIVIAFLLFQSLYGNIYGWTQLQERGTFEYLFGARQTETEYLHRHVSESLLADAITKELPPSSKIYLLHTGNRYALYQQDVTNSGYYSDKALVQWLKKHPRENAYSFFQALGVTHLALHKKRYERAFHWYKSSGLLSSQEIAAWNIFTHNHLVPSFQIGPYIVFEIRDAQ